MLSNAKGKFVSGSVSSCIWASSCCALLCEQFIGRSRPVHMTSSTDAGSVYVFLVVWNSLLLVSCDSRVLSLDQRVCCCPAASELFSAVLFHDCDFRIISFVSDRKMLIAL